jgi:hypothetical protein
MRDPCPADLPRRLPRPEASEVRVRREAHCLHEHEQITSDSTKDERHVLGALYDVGWYSE